MFQRTVLVGTEPEGMSVEVQVDVGLLVQEDSPLFHGVDGVRGSREKIHLVGD